MKKISKHIEDKLMQAIEKTAALVNGGQCPNEAIAKVAREDGIPPGNINLMVHAYNTGRTTRQRLDGATPSEKAADFPLAEATQVLSLMYPDTVKTAAAKQRESAISTEYAIPPTGLLQRREKHALRTRRVDWQVGVDTPEPYPGDPATRLKKAYCEAERLERQVVEVRRQVAEAHDKMASTFMELTDYFREVGSSPIPVVREQVIIMHGGRGEQVMDQLVKVTPGLTKFSRYKQQPNVGLEDATGEPYALVSQLLDEVDEYKRLKLAYQTIRTTTGGLQEVLLRPFACQPRSVLEEPPFSLAFEKTAAGGLTGVLAPLALAKGIFSGKGAAPPQPQSNQTYLELSDPEHEQQLRGIRSSAMLQDMLINDPVISGYEPNEVTNAYNEIVEMAPRSADKRLLIQALLRKRLEQGQLDSFEAESLLQAEESQKKLSTPPLTMGSSNAPASA